MIFGLSWRMTMRDWRAGELRFLIIALMVAVASLSSVGFFTDRLRSGLNRDAHQLLGADLLVSADQPVKQEWRTEAQRRGLRIAETVVFPSMAIAGEGDQAQAKLVSLKAVSHAYPLRGNLKLHQLGGAQNKSGAAEVLTRDIPASRTVWLDPALQLALNLTVGDKLKLGDLEFSFTQTIANEPDRGAGFMNFAPRAMISLDDLAATGLIQDGSRVTYRLLMAGDAKAIAAYQTQLKQTIEREQLKGVRWNRWIPVALKCAQRWIVLSSFYRW
jgi:putative ABC transport system permease protein